MVRLSLLTASLSCVIIPGSIVFAAPAVATDGITQNAVGTYDFRYAGDDPTPISNWVLTPCDDDANQCVKVAEFSLKDTARKNARWTGTAHWAVGSWVLDPVEVTRSCDDGTKYDVVFHYSWDAGTNSGWRSYDEPGVCGTVKPGNRSVEFTLTKLA